VAQKRSILEAWLALSLPDGLPGGDADPFHNPIGHTLRAGLPVLLDAVMFGVGLDEAAPWLERLVRIGAVQATAPRQGLSFLFQLKPILRQQLARESTPEEIQAMEDRIDSLALLAFDLFTQCREEAHRLQADEARRRTYVQRRVGGGEA
jgi:hypothetical protein